MPKNPTIKNAINYECNICNFKCSKLSNWNKHILTRKHYFLQNPTIKNAINTYTCECGKQYKHSTTLHDHKKKCEYIFVKVLE